MRRRTDFFVGIDEAGRGPLAGPVALGVVVMEPPLLRKFSGIRDSKQLTSSEREQWFEKLLDEKKVGNLNFKVAFVGNRIIDERGISYAVRLGIKRALFRLDIQPAHCHIFLDGLLKAPQSYPYQQTIIGGDEKIRIISLASVVAKVLRDRKMKRLSLAYKKYGFETHKGYGTEFHRQKLKKFGISPIHRQSFLSKILA
jgi:ribonuclease HII